MIVSSASITRVFELPPPAPATAPTTGIESPGAAREDGWLGQVPPPSAPPPPCSCPHDDGNVRYAVPALAPEPWAADDTLGGAVDPTLFG